jgi:hypothetical protein
VLNRLDLPLAHPLTQPFQLPVSPLVAAWAAAALVLAVALAWPTASERHATLTGQPAESWAGSLSGAQWLTRAGAVLLLVLAIAAGRLGSKDELENLAPALVVGAGWPALVLASVALGPVWRWIDPWDTLARLLTRGDPDGEARSVWPAALVAVAWAWYLSAYTDTLEPRSVGAILALYTVFTLAGCLALGRRRWLGTGEPLGLLLSWLALLPRRRLAAWNPPRGAEALLGVVAGGVLFGAARRSELWGDLNTADHALLLATVGVVASCSAGAVLLLWMAAVTRGGARHAGTRSAVPAVAGIIVAVAMDRNRLSTSIQLLPGLLGDPFGRGWDLLGEAGAGLDPAPFGVKGLLYAQLAVLLAGQLAGAVLLASRLAPRARVPVAAGLAVLAHASVIAIVSH